MTRSAISVVGGVYREQCIWPTWDQVYGSGGRAAAALVSHVQDVTLHTYACKNFEVEFGKVSRLYKFSLVPTPVHIDISFEYIHCMSPPVIRPGLAVVPAHKPIEVTDQAVLRFGMLEGSGKVDAERCVYDPQSELSPESFWANGSKAEHLAIVGNRSEIVAMADEPHAPRAAAKLLAGGAEVVVVKSGAEGAYVYTAANPVTQIPAYQSDTVWTIGSGDVFSAVFAAQWAVHRECPNVAAKLASRAVSQYARTMGLPAAPVEELSHTQYMPALTSPGKVYLASPFFNLGQRWLVDEARQCLIELGLDVFSPVHDVGPGPAHEVCPADLAALDSCDRVFAILDGLDPGTIFEVGYARAHKRPVYALAQSVSEGDLTMVLGSDCKVFSDFVTALHHTAWKI